MSKQNLATLNEKASLDMSIIEKVMVSGDLKDLTAEQCVTYYNKTCESLGLNPLTRPFDYIVLNGKKQLYARKDATEQLRKLRGVSITKLETRAENGAYIVTAYATDKEGRTDVATGAVAIANLKGDALVNAIMKAETKAKRRATLSIVGLGWLDETEIETIPPQSKIEEAKVIHGEIVNEESISQLDKPLEDYVRIIESAASMELLQDIFKQVTKDIKGKADMLELQTITQAKDKMKQKLARGNND